MKHLVEYLGLNKIGHIHYQLPPAELVEHAIVKKEGEFSNDGALSVKTGIYTGRSPNDRYIVDTQAVHDKINWGKVNKPIAEDKFNKIFDLVKGFLSEKEVYIFDGYIGASPKYRFSGRFITQLASQNLFCNNMFRRAADNELPSFTPQWTVISVPKLQLDPKALDLNSEAAVILNIENKIILVIATHYSGEIKKSIFTVMNYTYPHMDVFPMHCSCNMGQDGDSALFFGLSGTGKTTLSADSSRLLIGDDEHGWSDEGIFNFENGCYAKTINLSKENEPEIWHAIKFRSLIENVVIHPKTRVIDYNDESITANTRVSYPIEFIPNASLEGVAKQPSTVIFLTADAFGVMPPISKLSKDQAQYHFISGYTSKLAGTERGIKEPQATFSTCFGEPFMPLHSYKYAKMLMERVERYNARVYLINTGWSGGPYGIGKRISIPYTRAMVNAALSGSLENTEYWTHPMFNVAVPKSCPGVPNDILDPKSTWTDKAAYDIQAIKLSEMFIENFKTFKNVDHLVKAGPQIPVNK